MPLPSRHVLRGGSGFRRGHLAAARVRSPDLIVGASPSAVSFAGDQTNLPAFYAYDSNYLYSRYRMDADPRQGATTRKQ
jgi:hypothetical protein